MRHALDRTFVGLTTAATLLTVAMLVIILGDVGINGVDRLSWEFLTSAPEQGMTAGGIFPAIYGTVLLVLLM